MKKRLRGLKKELKVPEYPGNRKFWVGLYLVSMLLVFLSVMVFFDETAIDVPTNFFSGAVVYGPTATLGAANYSFYGEGGSDKAGSAMKAADFNNDNVTDILVGAYGFNNSRGKAYIIYGPFGAGGDHNLSEANVSFTGDANESLAYSLASGDVDNNGYEDILIGARNKNNTAANQNFTGAAYLIYNYGNLSSGYSNQSNVTFYGELTGDHAGYAVALGDLNDDGNDDVVIGAPDFDQPPDSDTGKVYVVFGSVASNSSFNLSLADATFTADPFLKKFGSDFSIGDVNGDGKNDLMVGELNHSYIFFGPLSSGSFFVSTSANVTLNGTANGLTWDHYHNIGVFGNVNNDSYDDILIGTPYDTASGGSYSGRAFLIMGNSSLSSSYDLNQTAIQFYPEAVDDAAGFSVAINDYDEDGFGDIFIGAPGNDDGGAVAGKIYGFYWPLSSSGHNLSSANESWVGLAGGDSLGLVFPGSVWLTTNDETSTGGKAWGFGLPPLPAADFTVSAQTGTAPLSVTFTDTSTGDLTSWAWDVDNNGVVDYTTQNPGHTYTSAGNYDVKLTVSGPGGSDSETKVTFVNVSAAAAPPPSGGGGGGRRISSDCTLSVPSSIGPGELLHGTVDSEASIKILAADFGEEFSLSGDGLRTFEFEIPEDASGFYQIVAYAFGTRQCDVADVLVEEPEPEIVEGSLGLVQAVEPCIDTGVEMISEDFYKIGEAIYPDKKVLSAKFAQFLSGSGVRVLNDFVPVDDFLRVESGEGAVSGVLVRGRRVSLMLGSAVEGRQAEVSINRDQKTLYTDLFVLPEGVGTKSFVFDSEMWGPLQDYDVEISFYDDLREVGRSEFTLEPDSVFGEACEKKSKALTGTMKVLGNDVLEVSNLKKKELSKDVVLKVAGQPVSLIAWATLDSFDEIINNGFAGDFTLESCPETGTKVSTPSEFEFSIIYDSARAENILFKNMLSGKEVMVGIPE